MVRMVETNKENAAEWHERIVTIHDAKQIDGVWLPSRVQDAIRSWRSDGGRFTVWEIELLDASVGNVTHDEIDIEFPPGTEVVDAIAGVNYFTAPEIRKRDIDHVLEESLSIQAKPLPKTTPDAKPANTDLELVTGSEQSSLTNAEAYANESTGWRVLLTTLLGLGLFLGGAAIAWKYLRRTHN